jgi:hypothetical protein
MKCISNIISIALIGGGVAGFAIASRPLLANKEVDVPLNVLGINRSPYGEVFAMAMQGPINTYFHAAEDSGHVCDDSGKCDHGQQDAHKTAAVAATGINGRVRDFIDGMAEGLAMRTNPRAASAGHKFHLRRGIEDKLSFAYNLDPGHYANYNAYHFFLTEPQLGTRPQLTPLAAKLADDTITYCLSRQDDPRLALTAAAASSNVIDLMFNHRQLHPDKPNYSIADIQGMLGVTDQAIGRFAGICEQWSEQGLWGNLSEMRVMEIEERARFVLKVRESQGKAVAMLSITPFSYGAIKPAGVWRTVDKHKPNPFGYGAVPTRETKVRDNSKRRRSPDELSRAATTADTTASRYH